MDRQPPSQLVEKFDSEKQGNDREISSDSESTGLSLDDISQPLMPICFSDYNPPELLVVHSLGKYRYDHGEETLEFKDSTSTENTKASNSTFDGTINDLIYTPAHDESEIVKCISTMHDMMVMQLSKTIYEDSLVSIARMQADNLFYEKKRFSQALRRNLAALEQLDAEISPFDDWL
ncbi:hypothetical protein [Pseudoalteromonas maricaloris]|uniref:hypothetical protein n=1 Tax=Pseudoalteromonas maricaloris TaxID=184924 RepID=UPI00057F5A94|nr:hypothetical protein [Pseudoalteromonas flavipulchra]KID33383.1 hypothetical protein QT15_23470 [Pseudoalteromonas flavipulchra NCIMB 2033 = ATCC BAA-314]MBD0781924.1 hypothetical protein [Pseudoalteromonas flavipulchra]MBE0373040.1 hypothetical protein [Pseudoalteromonas flavipulchra NCIMB 2033 = ATCC BAA-314]